MCYNYRIFKEILTFENYLKSDLSSSLCIYLTKFRLCNHKLPIQVGRYKNIVRSQRICDSCNVLGDEYHFLFICPIFNNVRSLYIPKYYYLKPSTLKYKQLFSSRIKSRVIKLAIFIKHIMLFFRLITSIMLVRLSKVILAITIILVDYRKDDVYHKQNISVV